MSVNVPMNKAQKDKDVAQKLQLYGIVEAFAEGKVPSVSTLSASTWLQSQQ